MTDQYAKDGVTFFRSQDVRPFTLSVRTALRIEDDFHRRLKKSSLQPGDVVIVRTGYPGTAAVVPDDIGEANCADLVIVRPGAELDPRVVAAFFNSTFGKSLVSGRLVGSAQQHFNVGVAADVVLSLPDRRTQQRMGDVVDAFSELIDNNTRRIEVLEETARSLYQEVVRRWPVGDGTGESSGGSAVNSVPFGDLCQSATQSVDPQSVDPGTVAVGLEHLPRRSTTLVDWGRAEELGSRKLLFEEGDVLFGKIRPYFHKVAVAPFRGLCSTDVIVLRSKRPELAGMVSAVASSDGFVAHAVQTSNGTKMPRADWKVLARYPVALPPEDAAAAFSRQVLILTDMASALALQNRSLLAARDGLLPKLVTGKVDVDALGIEEVFGWKGLTTNSSHESGGPVGSTEELSTEG